MSIFKIPMKFKAGEYKFNEIDADAGDCLALDYNNEYQLIYIYYKDVMVPERVILKFIKAEADRISDVIIKRKQTLARIFIEKFYDGEAVDIAVKTTEEFKFISEEYD